jgi:hypothetical protein
LEAGLTGDQAHRLAKQLRVDPDRHICQRNLCAGSPVQARCRPKPDLAERSEEILRTEPPGTAA